MTPVDVEGNLDLWKKVNHKNKFFVINKANSSKAGRPANYDFLRSKMVQIGKISSEEIPYVEDLSETTVAAIPIFDIPRLANQSSKTFALWTFKKPACMSAHCLLHQKGRTSSLCKSFRPAYAGLDVVDIDFPKDMNNT